MRSKTHVASGHVAPPPTFKATVANQLDELIDVVDNVPGRRNGGAARIDDDFTFSAARNYELNPKHGLEPRIEGGRYIGKRPTNPDETLRDSIPVGGNSQKRRIGYDPETDEISVFDRDRDWWSRIDGEEIQLGGTWHGHVRPWKELDQQMKQTLIKSGLFNRKGKFIGP